MNGRKAKELRRKAQALTVGMPARELLRYRRSVQVINSPRSTRGEYMRLKIAERRRP
ncbi:MAG: hypothetical protein KF822_09390 [Steroidobacteraceae bacterium]|nr:hypothetical protein [Steroidobacteraceae bacterium]